MSRIRCFREERSLFDRFGGSRVFSVGRGRWTLKERLGARIRKRADSRVDVVGVRVWGY